MSKDQIITISKETLRYFITTLVAAVGSYIGVRISMNDMKNDINNGKNKIVKIENNIGSVNIGWMYEQHLIHGRYIDRLVPNQLSLAKDCKETLLFNFDDLRGFKN